MFEAVSNAFYALEDRFGQKQLAEGRVTITVSDLADPEKIEVVVGDNGIGIDKARYDAFCEIDTDFKRLKGGKGVGRLFWLDAFGEIRVDSIYLLKTPGSRGDPSPLRSTTMNRSSLNAIAARSLREKAGHVGDFPPAPR